MFRDFESPGNTFPEGNGFTWEEPYCADCWDEPNPCAVCWEPDPIDCDVIIVI